MIDQSLPIITSITAYLTFRLAMLNHRKNKEIKIASDVTTAMNMNSGRDTDISS